MSANLETAVISKLKTWKEEQVAEIKRREKALVAQLQAVVPKSFSVWLREGGERVIENLVEYGAASRKYHRDKNEGEFYGYADLDEFGRRFKKLKAAWKGVVKISIDWDGTHRFEVTFKAI